MSNSNNVVTAHVFNEEEEEEEEAGMSLIQPSISSTSNNLVTAHVFKETVASLKTATSSLQATVDCLVLCYSSASPSNDDFRNLRTRLTKSASLYRDLHLPLSTQLFLKLSNLMSLFGTMDDAIFCEQISVVAGEVKHHSDHATKVIDVHGHLMQDLKKLSIDAQSIVDLLEVEAKRRKVLADKYIREAERSANNEIAVGASMVGAAVGCSLQVARLAQRNPHLAGLYAGGAVFTTALSAYMFRRARYRLDEYGVLSTAESMEGQMASQASEIIRNPLTAAVGNFVHAVGKIAGFLKKLEGDLSNYAANACRTGTNAAAMVIYLRLIQSQSSGIQQACGDYLEIVPAVEGRLGALSDFVASDPNHVQRWLALKFQVPSNSISVQEFMDSFM